MKNLIEKLDQKAGEWLNTFDEQVHETSLRVITGKVFQEQAENERCDAGNHQIPASQPQPQEAKGVGVLRQANARL